MRDRWLRQGHIFKVYTKFRELENNMHNSIPPHTQIQQQWLRDEEIKTKPSYIHDPLVKTHSPNHFDVYIESVPQKTAGGRDIWKNEGNN